ncbi:MAG: Nramp family divalent metal transporter [Bacteroidetes bacterium]|nr:Nramp family divalent metal transporter [Bacteroidota bacterium]MDA1335746.1 Nramp family divalent metal transporter [Bacteroidota bacterium]
MRKWLAVLGPGILFASTAIGVSHLVQSTRAGALVGFGLLWAVVAANIAKYPFFEFGSRYANATGESLIEGYRSLGKPMAWIYFAIAVGTCFFVMGAVGIVTASFLDHLFGISERFNYNATPSVAVGVMVTCALLLFIGKYRLLDGLIKVIAGILVLSTICAFLIAINHTPIAAVPSPPVDFNPWTGAELTFLIALMGWMPTAVDLSTWNSIWTLERIEQTGHHPPLRNTLAEFNFGYGISAVLACMFLTLGALLLYAQGLELPEGTAQFASGVVEMYTKIIGHWSWWIIAAAAASAMLGTCIACLDGYSRSMSRAIKSLQTNRNLVSKSTTNRLEKWVLILVSAGSLGLILAFPKDIRTLVDIATTLSFMVAPVIAAANWYLVSRRAFPNHARPPRWLHILSGLGLLFLIGFSILFLVSRF